MDHQVQGRALLWRVLGAAIGLFVVVALGAGGYVLLGWDALDAVYQSIITISTVGFREVRDLSAGGKVFTLLLIVIGVGAFTYLLTTVNNYLIADHLYGMLGRRAMQRKIDALEQHVIVCGYGRMGAEVAHEFAREKCPVVVIDRAAAATQSAIAAGHLALTGDAEADGVLKSAGVERARALIAVVDDDASNLMITISARAFSEKLLIVARANREQTERKLIAAGANRVLWPYGVSGRRMAHMALRPNVVEFLEVVMHDEGLELWLEEAAVAIDSPLDGKTVGELRIRETTGAIVVALRKRTGNLLVAPTPATELLAGDVVVALGTREQLAALHALASGSPRASASG